MLYDITRNGTGCGSWRIDAHAALKRTTPRVTSRECKVIIGFMLAARRALAKQTLTEWDRQSKLIEARAAANISLSLAKQMSEQRGNTSAEGLSGTNSERDATDARAVVAEDLDFRLLFESLPANYLVLEPDSPHFTIVAASDQYLAATMTTRESTLGRALFDVFPDANPQNPERTGVANLRASLEKVLETRAPNSMAVQRYDVQSPDKSWSIRYWAPRNSPVFGPTGSLRYLLHHVADVTAQTLEREEERSARQGVERLLHESEAARAEADGARQRLEAVLASIADAFYLLDRDWRFTYVNDAAEPLLQTTREALLGRTLWDAFPGVIGSPFEAPYREAMASGRTTSAEAYFPPLGTWFDVHTYAWSGGLMVHFRDIGARKASEAERERLVHALEVERARLEEVFRRAPSFIVAFRGPNHVYEFVNEAYYQLVGYRDIIGKPLLEAIPEIRDQGFNDILTKVYESGEPWVGREAPVQLQRTPDAPLEVRYLDMVFQPLTEADGTRSGIVVHGSDSTAQVLARREVEHLLGESERARTEAETARREAETANRSKSEFLAVMSHELRTPLNAIGGYAELMELGIRGPITAEQQADLSRIQQSQRHLLGLINGVLNYARVEAGAVEYAVEDVPLSEVLASCEALIVPQVRGRGLTFERSQLDEQLRARADREKVQQILLNLLSNAVKFTESGGRISVECVEGSPAATLVALRVIDTGIGIAADQLARVFEPFVQVDAKLTRTREGTGLGLAISRDLARGMGGDLTAESTPGVGSIFTLTLPKT
jgi:signal transduction histidine kinase